MIGQVYDGDGFILCKECLERRVPPSYLKEARYFCGHCYAATPGQVKHRASEARQRAVRRANAKQIHIGSRYVTTGKTVADATRIKAHIRGRLSEFKQRQSARAQAQGDPLGAVSAPATTGSD